MKVLENLVKALAYLVIASLLIACLVLIAEFCLWIWGLK
jgi:hypothetical protein